MGELYGIIHYCFDLLLQAPLLYKKYCNNKHSQVKKKTNKFFCIRGSIGKCVCHRVEITSKNKTHYFQRS